MEDSYRIVSINNSTILDPIWLWSFQRPNGPQETLLFILLYSASWPIGLTLHRKVMRFSSKLFGQRLENGTKMAAFQMIWITKRQSLIQQSGWLMLIEFKFETGYVPETLRPARLWIESCFLNENCKTKQSNISWNLKYKLMCYVALLLTARWGFFSVGFAKSSVESMSIITRLSIPCLFLSLFMHVSFATGSGFPACLLSSSPEAPSQVSMMKL